MDRIRCGDDCGNHDPNIIRSPDYRNDPELHPDLFTSPFPIHDVYSTGRIGEGEVTLAADDLES